MQASKQIGSVDEREYEVENVCDKKDIVWVDHYYVKWLGYEGLVKLLLEIIF